MEPRGLTIDSAKSSTLFYNFISTFRPEIKSYVEYSYGKAADEFGTMIVSAHPDFLKRVRAFYESTRLGQEWKEEVNRINHYIKNQLFYLKADWKNNNLQKLTIYFRLSNLVEERKKLFEHIPDDLLSQLTDFFYENYPSMIGIRISCNSEISISLYYKLDDYRNLISYEKLSSLAKIINFSQVLVTSVLSRFTKIVETSNPLWVGFELDQHGKVQAIKLDAEVVSVYKGINFLTITNEPKARIKDMLSICHSMRKDHFGYVALKFNPEGTYMGWKCYLGSLQRI